jgi:hypothetical protein
VGATPTRARFRLNNSGEVLQFLTELALTHDHKAKKQPDNSTLDQRPPRAQRF